MYIHIYVIGKTKFLLIALKLTKAGPLVSMVITSFAYSFIYGWPFAIGNILYNTILHNCILYATLYYAILLYIRMLHTTTI